MEMKIRVRKDTTTKEISYHYFCGDDGGILGSCYESILELLGMTFSFSCGICGKRVFLTMTNLRIPTLACEFDKDDVGFITLT